MEVVTLILIIVLSLISANNKKKKQAAAKGGAPAQPARPAQAAQPRGAIASALKEVVAALDANAASAPTPAQKLQAKETEASLARAREKAQLRAVAAKLQAQGMPGVPARPTVTPTQGQSAVDDEGCLGGSLPHGHEEGESREEHARHMAAIEARERAEAVRDVKSIDATKLRRAVVMAEILDRPKALRMRRGA